MEDNFDLELDPEIPEDKKQKPDIDEIAKSLGSDDSASVIDNSSGEIEIPDLVDLGDETSSPEQNDISSADPNSKDENSISDSQSSFDIDSLEIDDNAGLDISADDSSLKNQSLDISEEDDNLSLNDNTETQDENNDFSSLDIGSLSIDDIKAGEADPADDLGDIDDDPTARIDMVNLDDISFDIEDVEQSGDEDSSSLMDDIKGIGEDNLEDDFAIEEAAMGLDDPSAIDPDDDIPLPSDDTADIGDIPSGLPTEEDEEALSAENGADVLSASKSNAGRSGNGRKLIILLLVLLAGGGYYFLSNMLKVEEPVVVKRPPVRKRAAAVKKIQDPYVYPGAEDVNKTDNDGIVSIIFKTKSQILQIRGYYKKKLIGLGYTEKSDTYTDGTDSFQMLYNKGDKQLSLSLIKKADILIAVLSYTK